jgi:moderate conductance mechanosensitive channel
MDAWNRIRTFFADERLDANLIGFYGGMVVLFIVSLVVRRLLLRGGRLGRWTGLKWVHAVGDEAIRHMRGLLFWLTLLAMSALGIAGIVYHMAGRDLRVDAAVWYADMTVEELLHLGLKLALLAVVLVVTWFVSWVVRHIRPKLEAHGHTLVGCATNREHVCNWFQILERYAVAMVRLSGLWVAANVVALGPWADTLIGFVLRVLTIVVAARLLTLACRTVSHKIAELGDRHLRMRRPIHHYWERINRLLPFGVHCFEAAIYIWALSLCVREMHFIGVIADFGPSVVQCIGILFGTRVLIELLQVLLNEAFGMHDPERMLDAKGRTLVPLLQSVCQYVLYFGSGVVMLGVLGLDTRPILAGAGILGLAVGLGAQSLVTDVVSGFFILFETQYLVGDYVQIGDAVGTVEEVGIRLTQVRDGHGKLHIIPNGQIKGVINYSKGFVNAVVDLKVPTGTDLENLFRSMAEAGRRLRQGRQEVLADTEIQGLVDLGTSDMTVRAVTKVMPGTHGVMQSEYRRLLKQVFDQEQSRHAEVTGPRLAA